jgi:predicted metal-binding protein
MNHTAEIDNILEELQIEKFKWIDADRIAVAQWVRVKCQFGCEDYGLGACPPNTPSVADCERFFHEYHRAIFIPLTVEADKNHYPSDWSAAMTKKLLELERRIFLMNFPKAFLLNQSCCSLCKSCPGSRLECIDKKHSRPSPESFAVDVYQTALNIGEELHVIDSNPSQITRVALLMVD